MEQWASAVENLVSSSNIFGGVFKGKRVLVTGHTGFKGSWLCLWLLNLGADVAGFSLYLPSHPCNFEVLDLKEKIRHYEGDVRNYEMLKKIFESFHPEIVFHLAAQPIVRKSYNEPKLTFDTNVGGTVNVLECIKTFSSVRAAVIITSDKCYRNAEWPLGYRENDRLGGEDPYSASKACAEIACEAYIKSYFSNKDSARIATTRAGNVIGGGDWAQDRIIPDCVKAWSKGEKSTIRNPHSTRPWQHILEPLSGYLWLAANLIQSRNNTVDNAFNFGPDSKVTEPVAKLVNLFSKYFGQGQWKFADTKSAQAESTLLKLCCDKALYRLGWHCVLSFEDAVKFTAQWYKNYYSNNTDIYKFSCSQINDYVEKAAQQNLRWATNTADD